jgi:hypothetical protein
VRWGGGALTGGRGIQEHRGSWWPVGDSTLQGIGRCLALRGSLLARHCRCAYYAHAQDLQTRRRRLGAINSKHNRRSQGASRLAFEQSAGSKARCKRGSLNASKRAGDTSNARHSVVAHKLRNFRPLRRHPHQWICWHAARRGNLPKSASSGVGQREMTCDCRPGRLDL